MDVEVEVLAVRVAGLVAHQHADTDAAVCGAGRPADDAVLQSDGRTSGRARSRGPRSRRRGPARRPGGRTGRRRRCRRGRTRGSPTRSEGAWRSASRQGSVAGRGRAGFFPKPCLPPRAWPPLGLSADQACAALRNALTRSASRAICRVTQCRKCTAATPPSAPKRRNSSIIAGYQPATNVGAGGGARRGSWPAVHERQLAQHLAGLELLARAAGREQLRHRDAHAAREDQVEAVAIVALAHDRLALLVGREHRGPREQGQELAVEGPEHLHRAQAS